MVMQRNILINCPKDTIVQPHRNALWWTDISVFFQQDAMIWEHPFVFIGQLSKYFIILPIEAADRSALINYRPKSLTSVVCKQLEHVIAGYLMQSWDKNDWLYDREHGFRPGFSYGCQLTTVYQAITDYLVKGFRIYAITIDFSKASGLVPHDRLLMELAISGMDTRLFVWVWEFLVGRIQWDGLGGQPSKEVTVNPGVP
jgi:hypothetical protein